MRFGIRAVTIVMLHSEVLRSGTKLLKVAGAPERGKVLRSADWNGAETDETHFGVYNSKMRIPVVFLLVVRYFRSASLRGAMERAERNF